MDPLNIVSRELILTEVSFNLKPFSIVEINFSYFHLVPTVSYDFSKEKSVFRFLMEVMYEIVGKRHNAISDGHDDV